MSELVKKIESRDPSAGADIKLKIMDKLDIKYEMNEAKKDMIIDIQPDYDSNSDEDYKIICSTPEQANNTSEIIEDSGVSVDDVKKNVIYIKGLTTIGNDKEYIKLEKYLSKQGYKLV